MEPSRRADSTSDSLDSLLFHSANLTTLELRVWSFVRDNPRAGTLEIADALHVNRKSVGRATKRLLELGLLQEYPQHPRRSRDAAGKLLKIGYLALDPV